MKVLDSKFLLAVGLTFSWNAKKNMGQWIKTHIPERWI